MKTALKRCKNLIHDVNEKKHLEVSKNDLITDSPFSIRIKKACLNLGAVYLKDIKNISFHKFLGRINFGIGALYEMIALLHFWNIKLPQYTSQEELEEILSFFSEEAE